MTTSLSSTPAPYFLISFEKLENPTHLQWGIVEKGRNFLGKNIKFEILLDKFHVVTMLKFFFCSKDDVKRNLLA